MGRALTEIRDFKLTRIHCLILETINGRSCGGRLAQVLILNSCSLWKQVVGEMAVFV